MPSVTIFRDAVVSLASPDSLTNPTYHVHSYAWQASLSPEDVKQ